MLEKLKQPMNIINIILIILWLFFIFTLSADNAEKSTGDTEKVIITTVETIRHEKLPEQEKVNIVNKYFNPLRKSAHFFVYLVLGLLLFNLYKNIFGLSPKAFIYTIIFAFIYACTDEIHQLFVAGRSGEFRDILIDTSGTLLGTSIFYLLILLKNKLVLIMKHN